MKSTNLFALYGAIFAALGVTNCQKEEDIVCSVMLDASGKDTGFDRCSDGSINRRVAVPVGEAPGGDRGARRLLFASQMESHREM